VIRPRPAFHGRILSGGSSASGGGSIGRDRPASARPQLATNSPSQRPAFSPAGNVAATRVRPASARAATLVVPSRPGSAYSIVTVRTADTSSLHPPISPPAYNARAWRAPPPPWRTIQTERTSPTSPTKQREHLQAERISPTLTTPTGVLTAVSNVAERQPRRSTTELSPARAAGYRSPARPNSARPTMAASTSPRHYSREGGEGDPAPIFVHPPRQRTYLQDNLWLDGRSVLAVPLPPRPASARALP
jgi:hypothetical protein